MKIFSWFKSPYGWETINKALPKAIILYPFFITTFYLLFVAHDRYISISQVAVKKPEDATTSSLNIGLLMGSSNPSSTEDALYLKNYIESAGMLETVDKELDLRKAYSETGFDFVNSLPFYLTKESFLRYFQDRINITYEDKTGLLHIETEGFTPAFALKLNQAILKESERFINELSHKIIREQMHFAELQVHDAFLKLNKSKEAILSYQNQHGLLDPLSQAEAASKMIVEMESQKVQFETQLRNQLTFLKENTPQVISTRNVLDSLNKQITEERAKIAAPEGIQLNSLAAQFQILQGQLDFDTSVYKTALSAAEKTRMETARKLKVLSVVIAPQQAEEAEYPHRFYILLSLLAGCSLLYGTLRLIFAVIEDHRD